MGWFSKMPKGPDVPDGHEVYRETMTAKQVMELYFHGKTALGHVLPDGTKYPPRKKCTINFEVDSDCTITFTTSYNPKDEVTS